MYSFLLDHFGGITLFKDGSDFAYLQPGSDVSTFLDAIEPLSDPLLIEWYISSYDYTV